MLNEDGDAVESGRIQTTEAALRHHFEGKPTMRIALECGTHSPWISRLLEPWGHQVIVANARKIRAITLWILRSPQRPKNDTPYFRLQYLHHSLAEQRYILRCSRHAQFTIQGRQWQATP